jgi:hypothetical protein
MDVSCSPMTSKTCVQASGDTPMARRTVAAVVAKSRQLSIPPLVA